MLCLYCGQNFAAALPYHYLAAEIPPSTVPMYYIPKVRLQLDPIKHNSPAETHGQHLNDSYKRQKSPAGDGPPKPENLPFPPIPTKVPTVVSFHLPRVSFDHPPPLFNTSYSSSIKQPLLIEAAPLKHSKVADDSFLMPAPSSAWGEKFEPLLPETVPKYEPQPLPRLPEPKQPEIRVEYTQVAPTLEADEQPILLHHSQFYRAGRTTGFSIEYYL